MWVGWGWLDCNFCWACIILGRGQAIQKCWRGLGGKIITNLKRKRNVGPPKKGLQKRLCLKIIKYCWTSLNEKNHLMDALTLFYAESNPTYFTRGWAYMPPYHISTIFSGHTFPRRLQVYSKFKFCNNRTPKFGFGSKKFSYGTWEAAKVGWVVYFFAPFLPQNWL